MVEDIGMVVLLSKAFVEGFALVFVLLVIESIELRCIEYLFDQRMFYGLPERTVRKADGQFRAEFFFAVDDFL